MGSITGKFDVKDIETKKALDALERQMGSSSAITYKDNISKDNLNDLNDGFHFDEINGLVIFKKGTKVYKISASEF